MDKETFFTSNGLKTFCTMIGIKHITTTLILHRRMVQSQERCKRLNLQLRKVVRTVALT